MDERIKAFLADVLALEGESPEAIRETVRAALADCEAVFRAQEANRRMKTRRGTRAIRYTEHAWSKK